jgi:UTP--glucose-1-phosphate uridylyltransferase
VTPYGKGFGMRTLPSMTDRANLPAGVRKAVIPAAGLGTRFLPATKAMPKELLPLVDKPGIQWVVEEAVKAGITDILIITGRSKKTVEDHFDYAPELEASLERSGKHEQAAMVRSLAEMADVHFIRQGNPKGLGHAVGMARSHVGNEPFAVLLPDDLMAADSTLLGDMIAVTNRTGAPCIALKRFPPTEISLYGCVAGTPVDGEPNLIAISDMVEKPKADVAPSDLAIMGRYVLTPEIFDRIDALVPGAGGELQLTDAMRELCKAQDFYGLIFDSGRYDTGNKIDWLRATVEVALQHKELGADFRAVLTDIVRREGIA